MKISMERHEDMTDYGRGVCNEVVVTDQYRLSPAEFGVWRQIG